MKTWSFDSPDPESTRRIAAELGRSIGEAGLVIALVGPLGAGKTVFVKGLAEGLGIDPGLVSSPTFVIASQYPILDPTPTGRGPSRLHHVDLYRLESEAELESIGFFDMFEPGAVLAVEWADRFPGALGPERLEIELEGPSSEEGTGRGRRARVLAEGAVAQSVLLDWHERVERAKRLDRAGGGPGGAGGSPQRSVVGWLALALLLSGLGHLAPWLVATKSDAVCAEVSAVEEDAWGTRRVSCGEAGRSPGGIGGLLHGRPLALASVTAQQLEALPGIGASRAQAIVAAREAAPFERVRDLERVPGVGKKIRAGLERWLALEAMDSRPPDAVTSPMSPEVSALEGERRG